MKLYNVKIIINKSFHKLNILCHSPKYLNKVLSKTNRNRENWSEERKKLQRYFNFPKTMLLILPGEYEVFYAFLAIYVAKKVSFLFYYYLRTVPRYNDKLILLLSLDLWKWIKYYNLKNRLRKVNSFQKFKKCLKRWQLWELQVLVTFFLLLLLFLFYINK